MSGVVWEDAKPFNIGSSDWIGRAIGVGGMGTNASGVISEWEGEAVDLLLLCRLRSFSSTASALNGFFAG